MSIKCNETNEELVTKIKEYGYDTDLMAVLWGRVKKTAYNVAYYYREYAELDDMIQESYIALYDAINSFDQSKGASFAVYVEYWFRQKIKRYIEDCAGIVRIPAHEQQRCYHYRKAVNEFYLLHGKKPSRTQIAHIMGLSVKQIEGIEKALYLRKMGSLDKTISEEDNDITLKDLVSSDIDMEQNVEDADYKEYFRSKVWNAVDKLPDRQAQIIKARYIKNMTLKDVGKLFNISPERVRQLEHQGFRGIKKSGTLKEFYYDRSEKDDNIFSQSIFGVGVSRFNSSWTSSTERTAINIIE